MDKKIISILDYFLKETEIGQPVIVRKEDILASLPDKLGIDIKVLDSLIQNLTLIDMIKVTYVDKEEICVTPLAKAKLAVIKNANEFKEFNSNFKIAINNRKIFFVCFFGGFLGTIIGIVLMELLKRWV